MGNSLRNKVALVSGGASGIGAAHARVFAEAGAKVLICDVQEELGRAVAEGIRGKGGEADFMPVAVDDASMDAMAKAIGCAVGQLMFEPYPA